MQAIIIIISQSKIITIYKWQIEFIYWSVNFRHLMWHNLFEMTWVWNNLTMNGISKFQLLTFRLVFELKLNQFGGTAVQIVNGRRLQ